MIHSFIDRYRTAGFRNAGSFSFPEVTLAHIIVACLAGVTIGLLLLVSPWLAIAVAFGIIVCIAAFVKPVLLCYLIIVTVALTSGMERGKIIPLLRPNEAVLLFSGGIAFIIIVTRKTYQRMNLYPIMPAIIVLIGGTMIIPGISYLIRGTTLTVQDWLTLLAPLQYVLLFWLFTYLPSNNEERRKIIQLMLLAGAFVAAIGLMQGAKFGFVVDLLHNWYGSAHETEAATAGRVTSLMSAWNVLGIFLMFNVLIAWAFGISRPSDLGKRTIIITIALCTACLIISGSYAGVIGLVLGILIITFLLHGINRKIIVLFLILAIIILIAANIFRPLINERLNSQFGYGGVIPQTLVYRFKIWREIYLPAVQQNLVWGINPTVPSTFSWKYTESQYLTLLFSFGLIGLVAFLTWIGLTLIWLIRRFRQHTGLLKPVSAIAIAILLVLSAAGFTNAVLTYSGTADYLWILLALLTANENLRVQTVGDLL